MLTAIVVLGVLIVLNGVFAMSELAMMTARRSRLQQAVARGSKGAATALALAREPTRFLSTVQVGITLIGILSGAFAEVAISSKIQAQIAAVSTLEPYSDALALIVVVMAITYFSLVLGELVPKRIALAFPERVASTIARPLAALAVVAALPVKVLSASTNLVVRALRIRPREIDDVSEEDVRALVARAASTGVFTRQEQALFQRIMQVGDLTVRDLMVPRTEVVWIEEGTPAEELRVLVGTSPYSHFPVCRGSVDNLVGVVHLKDLITYGLLAGQSFNVSEVARQPRFVPQTMPALRMMDQFRRSKVHIAFVVDEYGGTLGLLTLNDVLSALIGDIGRRGEEPRPQAVRRDDGSWLIDGRMPLPDALDRIGVSAESHAELPDANTVAGLVLALLGHIPREGERVDWRHWRFEVVDMDDARIDKLLATRLDARAQAAEAEKQT
ncbi:MAG: HlyC/CorC family transporter [Phycisphaerae bacterium]|jgi:putative hemolysin